MNNKNSKNNKNNKNNYEIDIGSGINRLVVFNISNQKIDDIKLIWHLNAMISN